MNQLRRNHELRKGDLTHERMPVPQASTQAHTSTSSKHTSACQYLKQEHKRIPVPQASTQAHTSTSSKNTSAYQYLKQAHQRIPVPQASTHLCSKHVLPKPKLRHCVALEHCTAHVAPRSRHKGSHVIPLFCGGACLMYVQTPCTYNCEQP
jgi:hypothetical protein